MLQNVDFTVRESVGTAILGRNGSGKSTLLRAMSGIHKTDNGEILLRGKSVFSRDTRRDIGFVPQNDIAFNDLSVLDNLVFWGAAYGLDKKNIIDNDVIGLLGLDEVMKKKARTLSGGTRKRLSIAASILHNPSILIFDEPFSEIDIVTKQEFIEYLHSLKKSGKTIIITSHNAMELTVLCEDFYVISDKRVKAVGCDVVFNTNPEQNIANIIRRG